MVDVVASWVHKMRDRRMKGVSKVEKIEEL